MPKASPCSPAEYVFAKKGGAAAWGWRNPAIALGAAWRCADNGRISRAVSAIACGLVALIAKDIVGHGHFGGWLKNEAIALSGEIKTDSTVRFEKPNNEKHPLRELGWKVSCWVFLSCFSVVYSAVQNNQHLHAV